MAEILKHPDGKNKGIVMFTHKEAQHFLSQPRLFHQWKKLPYVRLNQYLTLSKRHHFYLETIEAIRQHYWIGMHFGWLPEAIGQVDFADFYMGKPSMRERLPGDVFFIPLDGSCFTPDIFSVNPTIPKYWDILCISRNAKFKNLDLLMQQIRKIYDLGYLYKVLLIVPSLKVESSRSHLSNIADLYYEMFTEEERERFTFLRLGSDLSVLGLSQTQLSLFYNSSKVFTLFSQVEGGSRVVSEALLCGLPLVVKDDLAGGGRDFLNSENSVQFPSFDKAYESLIEAVENYENLNQRPEKLTEFLGEEHSLEVFKDYLSKLYSSQQQQFDGSLINADRLNLRLNAHLNEGVAWKTDRFTVADIVSQDQFEAFISFLKYH